MDFNKVRTTIMDLSHWENREIRGHVGEAPGYISGQYLRECEYSRILARILPIYFPLDGDSKWSIAPVFDVGEDHHPDFTIWDSTFVPDVYAVIEVKSRRGQSWGQLLEQLWNQADKAKGSSDRLWAIGLKGFEICVFKFNINEWENTDPEFWINFKALNLSNLNSFQLNQLGVNHTFANYNNFHELGIIKWRLDDIRHAPYIHAMLKHVAENNV